LEGVEDFMAAADFMGVAVILLGAILAAVAMGGAAAAMGGVVATVAVGMVVEGMDGVGMVAVAGTDAVGMVVAGMAAVLPTGGGVTHTRMDTGPMVGSPRRKTYTLGSQAHPAVARQRPDQGTFLKKIRPVGNGVIGF
jgi:hypothetical protein